MNITCLKEFKISLATDKGEWDWYLNVCKHILVGLLADKGNVVKDWNIKPREDFGLCRCPTLLMDVSLAFIALFTKNRCRPFQIKQFI